MDGLDRSIDLAPLTGRQLGAIRFGVWVVALLFDGFEIVVESNIVLTDKVGNRTLIEDYRSMATELCKLIGLEVTSAERTPSGGLTLRTSLGVEIEITNSNSEYESFQLNIGTNVYVA
jgi:hypothetical protein